VAFIEAGPSSFSSGVELASNRNVQYFNGFDITLRKIQFSPDHFKRQRGRSPLLSIFMLGNVLNKKRTQKIWDSGEVMELPTGCATKWNWSLFFAARPKRDHIPLFSFPIDPHHRRVQ
jgi:hypothetical protein